MMEEHRPLHVTLSNHMSGANRSMLTLACQQAKMHPVSLVVPEWGQPAEEAKAAGVEVFSADVAGTGGVRRILRVNSIIRQVSQSMRLTHIHGNSATVTRYAYMAARKSRLPLVIHQRDIYQFNRLHYGLHFASHVIAISKWVKSTLPVSIRRKSTVIHNAVAMPEGDWIAAHRSGLRLGMAARPIHEKGFDIFLSALVDLPPALISHVELWGLDAETEVGDQVRQQIRSLPEQIARKISVRGFEADIDRFYSSVDVVVIPSRFQEPFGRVAIEAMVRGRTVVAAAHGGLSEIIVEGVNGVCFQPGSVASLRFCLGELLMRPARAKELALAGRQDALKRFSAEAHASDVAAVYRATAR